MKAIMNDNLELNELQLA